MGNKAEMEAELFGDRGFQEAGPSTRFAMAALRTQREVVSLALRVPDDIETQMEMVDVAFEGLMQAREEFETAIAEGRLVRRPGQYHGTWEAPADQPASQG